MRFVKVKDEERTENLGSDGIARIGNGMGWRSPLGGKMTFLSSPKQ